MPGNGVLAGVQSSWSKQCTGLAKAIVGKYTQCLRQQAEQCPRTFKILVVLCLQNYFWAPKLDQGHLACCMLRIGLDSVTDQISAPNMAPSEASVFEVCRSTSLKFHCIACWENLEKRHAHYAAVFLCFPVSPFVTLWGSRHPPPQRGCATRWAQAEEASEGFGSEPSPEHWSKFVRSGPSISFKFLLNIDLHKAPQCDVAQQSCIMATPSGKPFIVGSLSVADHDYKHGVPLEDWSYICERWCSDNGWTNTLALHRFLKKWIY